MLLLYVVSDSSYSYIFCFLFHFSLVHDHFKFANCQYLSVLLILAWQFPIDYLLINIKYAELNG